MNWLRPTDKKPELTGQYLVWTSGPDILRIEETFMEYADGTLADWDEIEFWAEIPSPYPKRRGKCSHENYEAPFLIGYNTDAIRKECYDCGFKQTLFYENDPDAYEECLKNSRHNRAKR